MCYVQLVLFTTKDTKGSDDEDSELRALRTTIRENFRGLRKFFGIRTPSDSDMTRAKRAKDAKSGVSFFPLRPLRSLRETFRHLVAA